jgi:CRP-like cAMP-binding protein
MAIREPTPAELFMFRARLAEAGVTSSALEPHLRADDVRAQTLLMNAGDNPDLAGVVLSGVVSEYYLHDDGSEHVRGFALAGYTFGSLSDALMQLPSRVFVRAETAATVLLIEWSRVEALAATSIEWERLSHTIVRELYLRKAVREYELLALDAMGRYQSLLQRFPQIEQQLSGRVIASYLGITPVHLSRLRRRRSVTTRRTAPKQ